MENDNKKSILDLNHHVDFFYEKGEGICMILNYLVFFFQVFHL